MVAHLRLRTNDENEFFRKKIGFDDSFDVTKCLQQIEISDILHSFAPCSEIQYDYSTIIPRHIYFFSLSEKYADQVQVAVFSMPK